MNEVYLGKNIKSNGSLVLMGGSASGQIRENGSMYFSERNSAVRKLYKVFISNSKMDGAFEVLVKAKDTMKAQLIAYDRYRENGDASPIDDLQFFYQTIGELDEVD